MTIIDEYGFLSDKQIFEAWRAIDWDVIRSNSPYFKRLTILYLMLQCPI